jgi:hypothetical protein
VLHLDSSGRDLLSADQRFDKVDPAYRIIWKQPQGMLALPLQLFQVATSSDAGQQTMRDLQVGRRFGQKAPPSRARL